MVDLRKNGGVSRMGGGGGSWGPVAPIIVALVAVAVAGLLMLNALFGERKAETAQVGPAPTAVRARPAAPTPVAVPAEEVTSWTRLEWYWKYDPRKEDRYLGRIVDQYGCAWWMEIGARVSGYKSRTLESYRHRAFQADGLPDCPKSEMPKPEITYLTDAEMKDADIDEMTIVSRSTVKAGDPDLVAYFRARRDAAADKAQETY